MAANKGIPDSLITLLADADKRNGLPNGTMFSIMQQESGGQSKFLEDPSAYHYGLNADGKRIAGHTGKISTAFGPFGILESTGAKPGYGVTPLKDKSIEEQVRFASDYLAARSAQAGGLQAGLAGYGEGDKYAKQVMARNGQPVATQAQVAPVVMAQATEVPLNPASAPQVQDAPVQVVQAPLPIDEASLIDPRMAWSGVAQAPQESIPMASVNFGPGFTQPNVAHQPNFAAFTGWGKRRA